MRVGIPKKGPSKALPHSISVLPKIVNLMVSNQQYDSHEGRFRQISLECFIVDCSTPCFRGVGVKARSGKEDTTLLSMVDRRVKQVNVSTTMIWNKTPDSRVSKGERTHRGSKHPSTHTKKKTSYLLKSIGYIFLLRK